MTATTREPDSEQTERPSDSQAQTAAGASLAQAVAAAPPRRPAADSDTASPTQIVRLSGTTNPDFVKALNLQLTRASRQGADIDEVDFNFMCSVVAGLKPRDQIEIMLAAQMAAVHMAAMTSAQRLRDGANPAQQGSAERAFNKLARTFASQMEALKRYRTGARKNVA